MRVSLGVCAPALKEMEEIIELAMTVKQLGL